VNAHIESDLGGVQTHVDAVHQALVGLGDDVAVVTSFSGGPLALILAAALARVLWAVWPSAGGRWHRWWHGRMLAAALARSLSTRGPEPVTFYAQCPTSLMLSRRVARDDDRVIAAIHFAGSEANDMAVRGGCRPGDGFDRSIREFERRTLPTADGLLFVSHASMAPVLEEYPEIERLPRRVLPNFLDDDWAGGGRAEPVVAARRLVTIGRLEARKNHRYGLEIVAAAAGRGIRFELTVVGTGPEMDNLLRQVDDLGIADRVRFTGRRADVRSELASAGCYLHTAVNEPFGFALIEAMAFGLPIVAVPTGGMTEIFFDGEHGRYLPAGEPDAAALMVASLTEDTEEMARVSRRVRDRFTSTFTTSAVASQLEAFLSTADRDEPRDPVLHG
jgi:glycosyltransferase involved in cell wall biosynthesis